jgi:hypothetical protein
MSQESLVRVWFIGMLVAAVIMAFVPNIYNTFVEERTEIVGESVSDAHIRDIAAQEAAKIQPGVTREYVDECVDALLEVDAAAKDVLVSVNDDYEGLRDVVNANAKTLDDLAKLAVEGNELTKAAVVVADKAQRAANRSHWFLILGSICGLCAMVVLIAVAVRQRREQRGK